MPSPNTYTLPTYIGPRVPTRAASACYSMAGRLHLGGFDTDYAKTPGPARYEVLDPSKIGPKSPAYSILSRNYMPGGRSVNDCLEQFMVPTDNHKLLSILIGC